MDTAADKRFARDRVEVSRAYRRLGAANPPRELDARIALHARAVLAPHRQVSVRARFARLALAASVLLSIMTLAIINLRSAPRNAEPSVRLIHAVATRDDRAQLRYPAPPAFDARPAGESSPYVAPLIPPRRLYSTDPPGSHPANPSSTRESATRRDPRQWQAHIEQLEREGRSGEAAAERSEFRQAYPGFH
jgi:hypothetical protein